MQNLPRCPHGVYNSSKDGEPSSFCSGCSTPEPMVDSNVFTFMALEWEKKLQDAGLGTELETDGSV